MTRDGRPEVGISAAPVLIAGGGPVGLATAVELAAHGIESVVVEPRLEPTRSRPRAKTLNVRTMEHFRRLGLADELRARAPLPTTWSQDISFTTTLLGTEVTRFKGVLGLEDVGVSPELGQQMPQYVLEDMLREVVADEPLCTFLCGWRVVDLSPQDSAVTVQVERRDGRRHSIDAAYVVGADGARSRVREAIGATYVGAQSMRPNVGVVFRCKELLDRLPAAPAVQSWLLNDITPGLMGPVDLHGTWWLIAFGVDGTSPDLDPERLVAGALGEPADVEIVATDPWTARMELVDHLRVGRIFLVGDAAHLNPPFGGHGLNTGIGDAVDLGWKLAARLEGWGGERILDSYEAERRPLQQRVIAEATTNNATLATELLRADLDAEGDEGQAARAALAAEIAEKKRVEYFSLDLVLGHRYERSPVIPDTGAVAAPDTWAATACPGRRLPHAWVAPSRSTLDLVGPGLTVLTSDASGAATFVQVAEAARVPMSIASIPAEVAASMGAAIVVTRPDQVVTWCGDRVPDDVETLVTIVAGRAQPTVAGNVSVAGPSVPRQEAMP